MRSLYDRNESMWIRVQLLDGRPWCRERVGRGVADVSAVNVSMVDGQKGRLRALCSWGLDTCLGRLWRSTLMGLDVATLIAARRSDNLFASA
jgi:hypothetical protein